MTPGIAFLFGMGCGAVLALVLFIMLNRKKPELVDKGEQVVRDFKR